MPHQSANYEICLHTLYVTLSDCNIVTLLHCYIPMSPKSGKGTRIPPTANPSSTLPANCPAWPAGMSSLAGCPLHREEERERLGQETQTVRH